MDARTQNRFEKAAAGGARKRGEVVAVARHDDAVHIQAFGVVGLKAVLREERYFGACEGF